MNILTLQEFADLMRIAPETAQRHAFKGKIRGAFKIGGQWRINMAVWQSAMEEEACTNEKEAPTGTSRSKEYLTALGLKTGMQRNAKKRASNSKSGSKTDSASNLQEVGQSA